MDNVSFPIAFLAGLLSFLSPCVLPLIPAYVSYLTGISIEEMDSNSVKLKVLYKSIGFIIGFSLIFVILGASVSAIGKLFASNQLIFRKIGGILIIIFGMHTMGVFKLKLFYMEKRFFSFGDTEKNASSVLMGMAFAAGWTPCVGPILSSILIYAGSMETLYQGILLLITYSLGLAIPFMLTALAIASFTKYFKKFSHYLPIVSIISGLLMIIMGVLVFANRFSNLSSYFNFINFY